MPDTTRRIVIIGAGAAGLTAAEALKQLGYTNVTVLERSAQAGGKCCSMQYEGRSYELGAGIISGNNTTVLKLAQRYAVPLRTIRFGQSIVVDAVTGQPLPKKTWQQKFATIYQLLVRYVPLVKKYRNLAEPGLTQLDPNVLLPFSTWAKQQRVELVANELALFFTGFGYDFFDRVPAAYVLKYYSWETLKAFARRQIYNLPNGIQSLWTTVAKQHAVHYNCTIQHITRQASGIIITTNTTTLQCDALIITSPLDEALDFLDATTAERQLFGAIEYCDYRTYGLILKQFPAVSGYIPGNYTPDRLGHPVFWYQRYADTNLYMFYLLADNQMTDEQAIANIAQLVQLQGGTIERTQISKHWKYFPHVSPVKLSQGYFDQLESLQGQQQTYYAGELCNFSTVGLTAEYAERLVQRFFA